MISEKVELLGKGLYNNIPDVLTLKALPTVSELDYVGGEDYDKTMLESILPKAVEEKVDFRDLLEIDYHWICRCLRLLNYGPYYTTNSIYCTECDRVSNGEYQVNLTTVECKPLPPNFVNRIKISKDQFIQFDKDVFIRLLTIQQVINAHQDKAFARPDGVINKELARVCYMICEIDGNSGLTPVEVKLMIQDKMSSADYILLTDACSELTNYGLRAGGTTKCPKCGGEAAFIALMDDRFLRPTVGDLRKWKHDRSARKDDDVRRDTSKNVRNNN